MIRTLLSRIWRYFTFKDSERYVDVLPDFHDPTIHFIAAWNEVITDGYHTTNPRLCSKSVKLTARYKQIFLLPVKLFSQRKCFCVRLLKVLLSLSLHHVRQTAVSNLCSRTSSRFSQHEKCFVVYLGNEISLTVYLSITDSFFLWGSQPKRLICVDAIFVWVVAPILYTLSLLTRFIPTKPMAVTQLPFSLNRWILFFRTANDNICLFYKWP